MKQAEYAAGVTRIYRKYLDQLTLSPGKEYHVAKEDKEQLLNLGNRCGFTDGYYTRKNGKDMITFTKPSHEKGSMDRKEVAIGGLGETSKSPKTKKQGNLGSHKEKIKGILRLCQETPAQLMLQYKDIQVEAAGEQVQTAQKQPLSKETVLEKMQKTGNTPFVFEEFQLEMDENSFLTVGALNQQIGRAHV